MIIAQGAGTSTVFNVGLEIHPQCPMRAAAYQLVRKVLLEVGKVLVMHPEEGTKEMIETVEAAVASEHDCQWILGKCRIPAVVSNVVAEPMSLMPSAAAPRPLSAAPAESEVEITVSGEVQGVRPARSPVEASAPPSPGSFRAYSSG